MQPRTGSQKQRHDFRLRVEVSASNVELNSRTILQFAFSILHFASCISSYGLAGSISTAMPLHFCCLNRVTLSDIRVKWPMRIASQMSVGSSVPKSSKAL